MPQTAGDNNSLVVTFVWVACSLQQHSSSLVEMAASLRTAVAHTFGRLAHLQQQNVRELSLCSDRTSALTWLMVLENHF